jgi:hypothetical protein
MEKYEGLAASNPARFPNLPMAYEIDEAVPSFPSGEPSVPLLSNLHSPTHPGEGQW